MQEQLFSIDIEQIIQGFNPDEEHDAHQDGATHHGSHTGHVSMKATRHMVVVILGMVAIIRLKSIREIELNFHIFDKSVPPQS